MKLMTSLWKAYLGVSLGIAAFLALSMATLEMQQRIVEVTDETKELLVPQVQADFRQVRNIELLRHYGKLVQSSTDPASRRQAAYMAALVSAVPATRNQGELYALLNDANRLIQDMRQGAQPVTAWPAMDEQLSRRADQLSADANALILGRSTRIRNDAVRVRNLTLAQAALFALGMVGMLIWGRVLMGQMKSKHQFFRELSHDFRRRIHTLQLSLGLPGQARIENAHLELLRAIDSLAELQRYLDNFLDVTHLEAARLSMVPSAIDLDAVFHKLQARFESVAEQRALSLRCDAHEVWLEADRVWLVRLLENLLGLALHLAQRQVHLRARASAQGGVQIRLACDGRPLVVREALDPQGAPDHPLSLAWSMVQRIADLMDARLTLRVRADRGTFVTVRLAAPPTPKNALPEREMP